MIKFVSKVIVRKFLYFKAQYFKVEFPFKVHILTATGDILKYFFRKNKAWHFVQIICLPHDSHKMQRWMSQKYSIYFSNTENYLFPYTVEPR